MENKNITLELTLNEVNNVLQSLGKMPFEQVAALISKITEQGNKQIKGEQTENLTIEK